MGGDWQHLIQSVIIGLIFSFLLAKLISLVTAFKEDNLSLSRSSFPPLIHTSGPSHGRSGSSHRPTSAPNYIEGSADLTEHGDDYSVLAEKGSAFGEDDILDDDSDDDWEGVETTELDEAFSAATAFVAASSADKLKVPNEVQLQLYGLYKIATEGPCSAPPPPAFKMTARAKWHAWQKLGAMPPEDAMQKYVEVITERFPNWPGGAEDRGNGGYGDARGAESKGPMGPVFSSYAEEENSGNDSKIDEVHAFAREGDVKNLTKCIDCGVSINLRDSEGRTPLHWAVDRGHFAVIRLLVSRNADVNVKDNEGQTPLHYAVICDREVIAEFLVKHNADSNMKDDDGISPVDICEKNWPWLKKQVSTDN